MTMLFDMEQYRVSDSQNHKGDWDGVKYDSAWDDGSAFPEKNYKTSIKEQARSNKTDCWYTPPSIIELVIQVLGEINLDPCADDGRYIPVQEHYTFDDNGLEKPWCGKVYMNPPYSHPGAIRSLETYINRGMRDFLQSNSYELSSHLNPLENDNLHFIKVRLYLKTKSLQPGAG